MPTVDVVVPCYNYAHYLRSCIDSILAQPGVDVRILIIDDASSDATPVVGAELAAHDPRVHFRRHDINKGHIATYNEGLLEWSTGDYVVLISADDLLAPGALDRAVGIMTRNENVGMVYGYAPNFRQNEDISARIPPYRGYRVWSGRAWLEGRCRTGHNVISSPEVVVRGRIQRAVGGYRPQLPHAGDLEMWMRIAAVSDIAYVRGAPQAFYRVHPKSMQRTSFAGALIDFRQRRAVFDSFFAEYGDRLEDAVELHRMARKALARQALVRACTAYDRDQLEDFAVDELVEFAQETYDDAASLAAHTGLRVRRALGPSVCNRTQLFAVPRLARSLRRRIDHELWKRRGV